MKLADFVWIKVAMSIVSKTTILVLVTVLTGCATQTPEERASACESTNWDRFGENDGRLGVPVTERAEQFEDCQTLGRPADTVAYRTGRDRGLLAYCTVENGYQIGYAGRRYKSVCPPAIEPDFLQGYNRGRKERPATTISPSIGIGLGSGGGIGVGVGIGLFNGYGARGLNCRWPYRRGYPYGYC